MSKSKERIEIMKGLFNVYRTFALGMCDKISEVLSDILGYEPYEIDFDVEYAGGKVKWIFLVPWLKAPTKGWGRDISLESVLKEVLDLEDVEIVSNIWLTRQEAKEIKNWLIKKLEKGEEEEEEEEED